MLISTYSVNARAVSAAIGMSCRCRIRSKPLQDLKGADRADDDTKDHALPVVRYSGRRSGEILRLRFREFQDRKNQPLRKRGIRDSREEGGNGHDRGV